MPHKDDEQRKLEEARRRAEEEETRRLEEEVTRQAESLRKRRQRKKEGASDAEIREEEERQRAERERKQREEEARRREDEEREERRRQEEEGRRKREEEERRRREEEERRRNEEEERRRREEEERRRKDEEARKRREEEEQRRKDEEARRRREEEERRRRAEEETRRKAKEGEEKRREEEQRRREEEKAEEERERSRAKALKKAEAHLSKNEFDKALAEIESILGKDPMHAESLALDEKIRAAQAAFETEAKEAEKAAEAKSREATVEAPPKPGKEKEALPEPKKPKAPRAKKPLSKGLIVGGIAAVIVVFAGIMLYQVTRTLFEGKRHIAVFPFTSQANTDEERTLGIGLAQETATLLAYIPNARIMGPATAVNMSRTTRNLRVQANQLNFDYTVRGTISAAGNSVVLNVEILDTLGNKMWTDRIDKPRGELMNITAELTSSIAEELSLPLPGELESYLAQPPTRKSTAYLAYLRGRELLHRDTYVSARSASRLFQQATEDDPQFAEAYAAAAHSLFHMYESDINTEDRVLTQSENLAAKATGIRQPLSEADVVLGGIAGMRRKYAPALKSLQRAVELMPSNSEALRLLGIVHAITGNWDKALENINRAYEFDPANADVLTSAALVNQRFGKSKEAMAYFHQALPYISDTSSYLAGIAGNALIASYQYDRGIALYERRVALNPGSYVDQYKLARAYQLAARGSNVWSKAFEKTIALIQQELRLRPQNALATAYLGLAYSRYGRYPLGEANGKRALQLAPNDLTIKYKLANIYGIQKKKTEALAALSDAIKMRYLLEEITDLDLFNISEEPEFLQTISLPLE